MVEVSGKPGSIRIGGGSAFFNDRLDAALELVEHGRIDVLMLETLAERTLALLHVARRNGGKGYWEALKDRLEVLLPAMKRTGTRFVTNAGGADPEGCARMVAELARSLGLDFRIAVVSGDDVSGLFRDLDPVLLETGSPLSRLGVPFVSANAYLGADAIAEAYAAGADIIITGRVTDSALALGPARARLNWASDDHDAIAAGVLAGHLLECGGQATGGYFAEPGLKEVPDLDRIGFPIAEVHRDGHIVLTKPPDSGGRIDRHTVTEQLLYEMHDPAAYLTPDVTLDVTSVRLEEKGADEVMLINAKGHAPPQTLKALVGVPSGFLAEVEISYGGINAVMRAQLAADTVRKRVSRSPRLSNAEMRFDIIGVDSVWPGPQAVASRDARLRVASRLPDRAAAEQLVTEVESLYVNGPAGGGGVRYAIRPTIRTYTAFVDRAAVPARWTMLEGRA